MMWITNCDYILLECHRTESNKSTFYPHRNNIKYVWNVKISKENREIKDKNSLQMTEKHA